MQFLDNLKPNFGQFRHCGLTVRIANKESVLENNSILKVREFFILAKKEEN